MKRYFSLIFVFLKNCLLVETEFRFSFALWVITDLMWLGLNLLTVQLLFGQITSIAGWTRLEIMLLVTVRSLFNSVMWLFVWPNLARFHDLVRKGELDFVLTKPVNSRFLVTIRIFVFDQFVRIGVAIYCLGLFLQALKIIPSYLDLTNFVFLFISGVIIFYNFCFMITTTNFYFTNLFNLENLFDSLQSIGQYPSTMFSGSLKIALVYFVPTIFISFFPTLALLGRVDISMFVLTSIFLIVSSLFSQWFWNFALRRYSSASS